MTEKEVETETWTEGEEQNEVVDGFQIEIYSISLPVMDATQNSVVLPWIVGLSSFVCLNQGHKAWMLQVCVWEAVFCFK